MSEIIERGAAAMAAKRLELIAQPLDRIWPYLMRSAIEAMRTPTASMCKAAHSQSQRGGFEPGQTWLLMIDDALTSTHPSDHSKGAM